MSRLQLPDREGAVQKAHEHMGIKEIGARLAVTPSRAHQIAQEYADFPKPVTVLAMGPVWHTEDIQAWMDRHPDRKPGGGGHQPKPSPRRAHKAVRP
jgi:predicted DNA-binding transcriptional regulator AlpA